MKILIANSNTNEALTIRMVDLAKKLVGPSTTVVGASAPFGAAAIETPADIEVAAKATLAIFEARSQDIDAAVVACFADPGLRGVQALSKVPVVGMAEASLLSALAVADRIAVITVSPTSLPGLAALIRSYGLAERVCSLRALPVRPSQIGVELGAWSEVLEEEIRSAPDEARAIVVGGAFLAGMSCGLSARVPIFNSLAASVLQAEAAGRIARANFRK